MKSRYYRSALFAICAMIWAACQSPDTTTGLTAERDPATGQVIVKEGEDLVLQFNYETVYEGDVIHLESAKPEDYTRREVDTFVTAALYAVPRSNYIHPIYGLDGEMLTRDWPEGAHPHHRGVFWSWPEIEYGSEMADLYALQQVFARPTGSINMQGGPDYALITAENEWRWNDEEPIVLETATMKIHKATPHTRIIDLAIRFVALQDSITIATRNTDSYGGLNIRMQTPENQAIAYHTDEADAAIKRAWSTFSGNFDGGEALSGLAVLQHSANPEYPGSWQEYPDLAWVQPTFPTHGTRYPLRPDRPLDLRYRLVIYKGEQPDQQLLQEWWDNYQSDQSVLELIEN